MNDSRDLNSTTTAKNVKKTITIVSTAIIVAIVSFSTTSSSISSVTMVLAQQTDNNTTTTPTPTITLSENVVQVNATEIKGYKWQINGQFNPDLRMLANTAYTFTVQNPTDSTHNLIIADSQGKDLATSGDIQPGGGSGILNFKTNMTSSGGGNMLGYHCEYHPDLMKGSIQIVR
jgi:hypothetical protein